MSHKAKIVGVKVSGSPFLGLVSPRAGDGSRLVGPAVPVWSSDPDQVLGWLSDGYRLRTNDQRALRSKYVREPDPDSPGKKRLVTDSEGQPVLRKLGLDPREISTKQARQQRPHLSAVPERVLHMAIREENTSWFAAVKRRKTLKEQGRSPGAMPGMYSKKDQRRFRVLHHRGRGFKVDRTGRRTAMVTIFGQNPPESRGGHPAKWQLKIRVRASRPIAGCSSIQVNMDRGEVVFTTAPAAVQKDRQTGSITGIDRGVAHTAATSDGSFFDAPDTSAEERAIKYHDRKMAKSRLINNPSGAKKWTKTNGYRAHQRARAEAYRAKNAKITDFQHKATTHLVRTYDWIGLESLKLSNMMRSAKGSSENPGAKVAQKSGLNRVMATAAMGRFGDMIIYKSQALAGAGFDQQVAMVPAYNTSRECNKCHHICAQNRESQAVFACQECGHTAHADTNAALNVEDRAMGAWGWTAGNPAPSGSLLVVAPAGSQEKTEAPAGVLKPEAEGGTGDELRTYRASQKGTPTGISGLQAGEDVNCGL